MSDATSVLQELLNGLEMTIVRKSKSGYKVVMPDNEKHYRRVRISNHPYSISEWAKHEIDGLPNVRYSIFIYNSKSCPQLAKLSQTEWRSEYSEGVPIYEKGFNENYLHQLFPKLIGILTTIYSGSSPEPNNLPLKINEKIQINKNMANNRIKLTENELKQIVAESVKKVLMENISENYWDEINRLLTNLYGWAQFYEEEFDKANIKDNGGRYSMRGALSEMQNIIGRLSDLCNDGRKMYN